VYGAVALPMEWGLACSTCYSLIYGEVERPPMREGFGVLIFQLSLVFYFIQASVQLTIKVPGSWRSEGLWLCSSHHLGSLPR
jgi:hypothetical protein